VVAIANVKYRERMGVIISSTLRLFVRCGVDGHMAKAQPEGLLLLVYSNNSIVTTVVDELC